MSNEHNPFAPPSQDHPPPSVSANGASLPLAPTGDRLLALLLDGIFWMTATCGLTLPLALGVGLIADAKAADDSTEGAWMLIIMAFALGLPVAFNTLFELSPWRGTPGKRFLRLEVRGRQGKPAGLGSLLIRNIVRGVLLNLHGCCTLIFGLTVLFGQGHGLWNLAAGTSVFRVSDNQDRKRLATIIVGLAALLVFFGAVFGVVFLTALGAAISDLE